LLLYTVVALESGMVEEPKKGTACEKGNSAKARPGADVAVPQAARYYTIDQRLGTYTTHPGTERKIIMPEKTEK